VLELQAGLGYGVDDVILMRGGAAGEQGGGDGDADGAANVAHEIEEAAGVADLVVAQGSVGLGGDGHEDKAEGEAGDEDGNEERGGRDVWREVAEVERGEAEDEEAEGEQVAGVGAVGKIARGATTIPAVKAV